MNLRQWQTWPAVSSLSRSDFQLGEMSTHESADWNTVASRFFSHSRRSHIIIFSDSQHFLTLQPFWAHLLWQMLFLAVWQVFSLVNFCGEDVGRRCKPVFTCHELISPPAIRKSCGLKWTNETLFRLITSERLTKAWLKNTHKPTHRAMFAFKALCQKSWLTLWKGPNRELFLDLTKFCCPNLIKQQLKTHTSGSKASGQEPWRQTSPTPNIKTTKSTWCNTVQKDHSYTAILSIQKNICWNKWTCNCSLLKY